MRFNPATAPAYGVPIRAFVITLMLAISVMPCAAANPDTTTPREVSLPHLTQHPAVIGRVQSIAQVSFFRTGFDELGQPLPVPSIDPAGIYHWGKTGQLLITDSEINEVPEVFDLVEASAFALPPTGTSLDNHWDLTQITGNEPFRNREPTGITFCPLDKHFYITNDDLKLIYRYAYVNLEFVAVDSVLTSAVTLDPEGITCDPLTGDLYVIGGTAANISVYKYDNGFSLSHVLTLSETAGHPDGVLSDAEGIVFDPVSRNLFVISDPVKSIIEYTLSGKFVRKFPLAAFVPAPISPQGLTIGPSTVDPARMAFYIADAGLDNDQVPEERDGVIYEVLITRVGE